MKSVKKAASLILAVVMVLALALPAMAAGTYSIKIKNDKPGHTYEAYQIFAGDLHEKEDGTTVLSNIEWGTGVTPAGQEALGVAREKAETITIAEEAAAFAKEVAAYLTDVKVSTDAHVELTLADNSKHMGYVIGGLEPGYYLVKDLNGSLEGAYDAQTSYILQVVGDVEAAPKSAMPSVDKQVHDEPGDSENGVATGWGETADHAINESFQFKLTATLPADVDFADYETYKVKFTDTMSAGVTFESIASVKVNGTDVPAAKYICTAIEGQAGGNWTLTIEDIKTAVTGVDLTAGATVEVIYNAHLNEAAYLNTATGVDTTTNENTVALEYSNNPNGSGLGKTEEDNVWVFTYKIENTKVDGDTKAALAGAGFRLYTTADVEIPVVSTGNPGEYRLAKDGEAGVEMKTTAETNRFNIIGLDTGTYVLKETTTPAGYNTCEDITVTITATHVENQDGAGATTTLTSSSNMSNTVENFSGVQLPGTGGIGTTIFYVVGGLLVVGAAVLLIAKKRADN